MAIFDDLEGVLGPDAVAKLKADPKLQGRLQKGEELLTYYTDGTAPPAGTGSGSGDNSSHSDLDLTGVEKMLDIRLSAATEKMKTDITAAIGTAVADEIKKQATPFISVALRNADELNRIYSRHERETGQVFDSKAFNDYVEEQKKAGRNFGSLVEAYEAMTEPDRRKREIETGVKEGVREELKKRADRMVPGTSMPTARTPLGHLMSRGRTTTEGGESGGSTAVQRAAANLEARLARSANTED